MNVHKKIPMRRRRLMLAACSAALPMLCAFAHSGAGPVTPPEAAPAIQVVDDRGRRLALPDLLRGRRTVVQTMYTGCSSICSLQGALFERLQRALLDAPAVDARLLSLSIDPLTDTPEALRSWLARWNASASWRAAAPEVRDVEALRARLGDATPASRTDIHGARVYVFDREARLRYRSVDFPPVADVRAAVLALP